MRIVRKKIWLVSVGLAVLLVSGYMLTSRYSSSQTARRVTDPDFIMLVKMKYSSKSGNHIIGDKS